MIPPAQHYSSLEIDFRGLPLVLTGVVFYPACPATDLDPPEPAWAEWDSVYLQGSETPLNELFAYAKPSEDLQEAVVRRLES